MNENGAPYDWQEQAATTLDHLANEFRKGLVEDENREAILLQFGGTPGELARLRGVIADTRSRINEWEAEARELRAERRAPVLPLTSRYVRVHD